jgi:probable rRNA maturation factor
MATTRRRRADARVPSAAARPRATAPAPRTEGIERPALTVDILSRQRRRRCDAASLRRVVQEAARLTNTPSGEVVLVLTGDRLIRSLNQRFRGNDKATDVLSFVGQADGSGDVIISVETAARNARVLGQGLGSELERLALHGYLHLLGYDHETDEGEMLRLERRLARRLSQGGAQRRRATRVGEP